MFSGVEEMKYNAMQACSNGQFRIWEVGGGGGAQSVAGVQPTAAMW